MALWPLAWFNGRVVRWANPAALRRSLERPRLWISLREYVATVRGRNNSLPAETIFDLSRRNPETGSTYHSSQRLTVPQEKA